VRVRVALQWFSVLLATGVLACLVVYGWLRFAPRGVPNGQPPLVTMTPDALAGFRRSFNASEGDVRILAMLSPT
jgi:hypothetical protein